jgi:hypothetical protein
MERHDARRRGPDAKTMLAEVDGRRFRNAGGGGIAAETLIAELSI